MLRWTGSACVDEPFATDLAWDTTGTGNCWSGNHAGTSFPPELPSCF